MPRKTTSKKPDVDMRSTALYFSLIGMTTFLGALSFAFAPPIVGVFVMLTGAISAAVVKEWELWL